VIDVADGADIHVRFGPHELLGKRSLLYCLMMRVNSSGDGGDSWPDRRRGPQQSARRNRREHRESRRHHVIFFGFWVPFVVRQPILDDPAGLNQDRSLAFYRVTSFTSPPSSLHCYITTNQTQRWCVKATIETTRQDIKRNHHLTILCFFCC
jgi:hypothetical protein